mmetsp:Transcript_33649/g.67815  ORF Transcript_33649/g.67815 Transcript_33649/m.67815 type:complete len:298 (-) Transcript_33649:115-1008(-)
MAPCPHPLRTWRSAKQAPRRRAALILFFIVAIWAWSDSHSGVGSRAFTLSSTSVLTIAAKVLGILLCSVVACLLAIVFGGGAVVATLVKAAVEKLDRDVLGVDVTIESLEVSIYRGLVDIKGLVVANAQGYSADYLLKVDRALADVSILNLIRSGLREIIVEKIIFSNVDVIWEKSGMTQSNVKEILEHMAARRKKVGQSSEGSKPKAQDAAKQTKKPSKRKVIVREVKFEDIGVKIASHILQGAGMRVAIADIDYPDFSADHGSYIGDDIAEILLMSLLKTVVENTAGKSIGDKFF